jgi:hypothetical protein
MSLAASIEVAALSFLRDQVTGFITQFTAGNRSYLASSCHIDIRYDEIIPISGSKALEFLTNNGPPKSGWLSKYYECIFAL